MTENDHPFIATAIGSDSACGPRRGHIAMAWRLHQHERRRARHAPLLHA